MLRLAERFGQLPQVIEANCDAGVLRMLALEHMGKDDDEASGRYG